MADLPQIHLHISMIYQSKIERESHKLMVCIIQNRNGSVQFVEAEIGWEHGHI